MFVNILLIICINIEIKILFCYSIFGKKYIGEDLFEKEEKEVKSSKKNIIFDNYIINNMFRNLWV